MGVNQYSIETMERITSQKPPFADKKMDIVGPHKVQAP